MFHKTAASAVSCVTLSDVNTDTISQLEFSVQGDPLLVSSGWDQTIRIWKFDDWSYQNPKYLDGIRDPSNNAILRFCFDQDCTKIYYGTTAGEIKEYDFRNQQKVITKIKNVPLELRNQNGQHGMIPPSKYIISGLKWNDNYKLVVALFTNGYEEKPYPHSFIGYVDPSSNICVLSEIQFHKIINIDLVDDQAFFISISVQDLIPKISYLDLSHLQQKVVITSPFNIIDSEIQSIPTSIAALPSDLGGYIVSTSEGFVEINEEDNSFCECVFKQELGPNQIQTFPANCVSACKYDRKIAMVCSKNELALFNLNTAFYRIFTPSAPKIQIKYPITACAFSPNGEFFAVATGYDWAKGAEEMKKIDPKPLILIGKTPDAPDDE